MVSKDVLRLDTHPAVDTHPAGACGTTWRSSYWQSSLLHCRILMAARLGCSARTGDALLKGHSRLSVKENTQHLRQVQKERRVTAGSLPRFEQTRSQH